MIKVCERCNGPHYTMNHTPHRYDCPVCGQWHKTDYNLLNHLEWAHADEGGPREMSTYKTIGTKDVGKSRIKAFGRTWLVSDFVGRIFPNDVGKRVYFSGGILQVENEEQRAMRIGGRA